jgi:hypothetical protein
MKSNVPMKQQTKPRQIAERSPVVPGLSLEQRLPKGSETPPFTCPNSTHLHSTHSHFRYSLLVAICDRFHPSARRPRTKAMCSRRL